MNDALEGKTNYDANDYEYTVVLTKEGPNVFRSAGPGGTSAGSVPESIKAVIHSKDGYITYQLAIPWKELSPLAPIAGRIFGFNLIINDNDNANRTHRIGLSPGNPYSFRKFVLSE